MNKFDTCDVALYTKNCQFAYEFRTKCHSKQEDIEYLNTLHDLFRFVFNKPSGILFIDMKYFGSMSKIINEFCGSHRNKGEFVFVDVCDNNTGIKINNYNIFWCKQSQMLDFLLKAKILLKNFRDSYCGVCINNLKMSISKVLEVYKISPKLIGFEYLQETIFRYLCQLDCRKSLNSDIYPDVAKEFDTCINNVEKNIRKALKKASENYPDLYSSMSFKNNHVTIKTFVSVISEEIERSVNVGLVRKLF